MTSPSSFPPSTAARPAQTFHTDSPGDQLGRPFPRRGIHRRDVGTGVSQQRIRLLPRHGGVRFGKDYGPDISPLLPCRNAKGRIYPTGDSPALIQRGSDAAVTSRRYACQGPVGIRAQHRMDASSCGEARAAALDQRGAVALQKDVEFFDTTKEHAYDLDLTPTRRIEDRVGQRDTLPNMSRKECRMQTSPVTTELRDVWDDATEDGVVCLNEMATITMLIARADDGVRLALSAMKRGPDVRRVREGREEFARLHGPIDFEAHRNARMADTDPDAA